MEEIQEISIGNQKSRDEIEFVLFFHPGLLLIKI